tara:strand:- start:3844 stop:4617 length:774 start_codon:yes stop_codon:yes gene_type:complete
MLNSDKNTEFNRFEKRAEKLLLEESFNFLNGSDSMPEYLRSPYLFYEKKISELIKSTDKILEIGSGVGLHTYSLLKTGASVTASDISKKSLEVLRLRYRNKAYNLKTKVADIERLPFTDNEFTFVFCAGSLSYGREINVDSEIIRVLAPGGKFICVDSLNNNPIYKINRYLHFRKGNRSKMTLINMPTIYRIKKLKNFYHIRDLRFYGSISYLMPLISRLCGERIARKISDYIDKILKISHSAFKFVLVAELKKKNQ